MSDLQQKKYLERINELVFDEEQIVTAPNLARILNISIHEARLLLEDFTTNQESLPTPLTVTNFVSGHLKGDTCAYGAAFYKADDLDAKNKYFERILSESVYSVQKHKADNTWNTICLAQNVLQVNAEPVLGAIVGANCVKTPKKVNILPAVIPQSVIKEIIKTEPKNEASIKPKTSNVGGITNFFTKNSSKAMVEVKSKPSAAAVTVSVTTNSESLECEKHDKENIVDDTTSGIQQKSPKRKRRQKNEPLSNTGTPDKGGKTSKKRRRIEEMSDSDEDIFSNEPDIEMKLDELNIASASFADETDTSIKDNSLNGSQKGKTRSKKAIDRTFMDEDGYIVTKKEFVFVSDDESEQINEANVNIYPPKNNAKALEKKNSTTDENEEETAAKRKSKATRSSAASKKAKPVSGKQPTLMSFFTKK